MRCLLVLALASAVLAQEKTLGPELSAVNVVNAADLRAGGVAPSEVVILYPSNAGPAEMAAWALDRPHQVLYSVGSLGDTRVLFDDLPAPMVYAVSGRICAIVPAWVAGKESTQVVVEYQGRRSAPVTLPVVPSAPALFTLDASGTGQAAMLNETGCCNSARNPAVRGTVASLYATGEGLPLPGSGQLPVSPVPMKVTVGGVPAEIQWAGNLGVLQVNFRVPATAPVGDAVPLVLTVGDAQSSAAATMAVRPERQQVLAVSGDPAIRRRFAAILGGAGYDVWTARDGREALELSQAHNVDLVIADLALPPKDNLEMVGGIRQAHQQVKTVAVAQTFSSGALKAADLLGAQAVLTKPVEAQLLLQRVRSLLLRRPARY